MSLEVVTYANKSFGLFEKLVNNEHGVPVKVLGWGTKWNGFSDKSKGLFDYIQTKNDDDIILFIDGFDSLVNKPIDDKLTEIFKQYDCGVLLSRDREGGGRFSTRYIFGRCGDYTANAGMYMGYVKYLKKLLSEEINMKCLDDQRNFNMLCNKYNFIKIDSDEKILKNITPWEKNHVTDAYFISFPGKRTIHKRINFFRYYIQFFIVPIIVFIILAIAMSPKWSNILIVCMYSLLGFLYFFADTSCMRGKNQYK
jgi:hypothetical protein